MFNLIKQVLYAVGLRSRVEQTDSTFINSNGDEQNIAQGDGAIGKQVNYYNTAPKAYPPCQPPPLNAHFLGREEELSWVLDRLQPGKILAICGPGGMGKSALAAQAVHQMKHYIFPDGIFFHSFYHQRKTDVAFKAIARSFSIIHDEKELSLQETLIDNLSGRQALLILDGTEEADDLSRVLKLCSTCGALITSRKREDANNGDRLDLSPLPKSKAIGLLRAWCSDMDNTSLLGIYEILGGWPVALRIAGHSLSSTGEDAATYLRWLKQEPFKELGNITHQQENAALLLRRSIDQMSTDARLALGLAGTLAFAPISVEPITFLLDNDKLRARTALNQLVNYGMLVRNDDRWQTSHVMIYIYSRDELALSKEMLEHLALYYVDVVQKQDKSRAVDYA